MASNDDDDRELFERALESISPGEVFRGKYGSPADAESMEEDEPGDASARAEIERLREQREMESAFAGVEKLDSSSKYHVPAPRDDDDADALRAEFEAALAGGGPAVAEPERPAAKTSLAEAAPEDVHTLNLRGFEPQEAITKLGLFVDLASKDRHEMIRLLIGSSPPLLDAVEQWFRDAGVVYLRELEVIRRHGDAAVFARIRRMDPS